MEPGKLLRAAALAAAVLFVGNQLLPGVPLALIPHDSASRPDPRREPLQTELDGAAPFRVGRRFHEFRLVPRAGYDIAARVVGTEPYHLGLAGAILPWDLALAWGDLVGEPYLSAISYEQFSRFYNWSTRSRLDFAYVSSHSANVHVAPAGARVSWVLPRLRRGDVVRLEGKLVDVEGPDGFSWKTSLSRTDTGPGACETLWLEAVTVGTKRYR